MKPGSCGCSSRTRDGETEERRCGLSKLALVKLGGLLNSGLGCRLQAIFSPWCLASRLLDTLPPPPRNSLRPSLAPQRNTAKLCICRGGETMIYLIRHSFICPEFFAICQSQKVGHVQGVPGISSLWDSLVGSGAEGSQKV